MKEINEISKTLKSKYVSKATRDIAKRSFEVGVDDKEFVSGMSPSRSSIDTKNDKRKIGNRIRGIDKAMKEENEINEISNDVKKSYLSKAAADVRKKYSLSGGDKHSSTNLVHGKLRAKAKQRASNMVKISNSMKEENEINEISNAVKMSYIRKASKDLKTRAHDIGGDLERKESGSIPLRKPSDTHKDMKKVTNRLKGIRRATRIKEENEESNQMQLENIISAAVDGNALEVKNAVSDAMLEKIRDAIEDRKAEVAQNFFNYNNEEEMEETEEGPEDYPEDDEDFDDDMGDVEDHSEEEDDETA